MIELNGKKFAESTDELDENCAGTAKRSKRRVQLFNQKGEMIGVINRHGVLCCATRLDCGGFWYSHATIKEIGEWEARIENLESRLGPVQSEIADLETAASLKKKKLKYL